MRVLDACCQPKAARGVEMSPGGRPPRVERHPERYWIVLVQFLAGSGGKAARAAPSALATLLPALGGGRSSSVAALPSSCSMEGHPCGSTIEGISHDTYVNVEKTVSIKFKLIWSKLESKRMDGSS